MNIRRRTLIKGVAGLGATAVITGQASAADGRVQYIVRSNGKGAGASIEDAGFDVRHELADGSVLVVTGPKDAAADLKSIGGVVDANPDVTVDFDLPEVNSEAEDEDLPSEGAGLADLQWDIGCHRTVHKVVGFRTPWVNHPIS